MTFTRCALHWGDPMRWKVGKVGDIKDIGDLLDLNYETFRALFKRGRMHRYREETTPYNIGSGQTFLSEGLSNGYSIADIAHFYVKNVSLFAKGVIPPAHHSIIGHYCMVRDARYEFEGGHIVPGQIEDLKKQAGTSRDG